MLWNGGMALHILNVAPNGGGCLAPYINHFTHMERVPFPPLYRRLGVPQNWCGEFGE